MSSPLLKIASAVPLALLGVHWLRWNSAVDGCLDRGGVFDYERSECRTDIAMLPASSYLAEHAVLVGVLIFASATMLLIAFRGQDG